jgi:hypothetical protein
LRRPLHDHRNDRPLPALRYVRGAELPALRGRTHFASGVVLGTAIDEAIFSFFLSGIVRVSFQRKKTSRVGLGYMKSKPAS